MAEKRYYWLKLSTDFFKSKRIKKLRKLAGGDTFTIIYLKMQLLATKTEGILKYTGLEDTVAEEIALDIDEDPQNVQITLNYLLRCGLCEDIGNDEIALPYVMDNLGSETSVAKRVRDFRARQKALRCNTDVTPMKQIGNVEIEIEIEKEKDINILSSKKQKTPSSMEKVKEIVDYLNLKANKRFKSESKATQRHILGRLNEGYGVEDFKSVIDVKTSQWGDDPKMSMYLRPETLFAGHFEGYLNEAPRKTETPKEPVVDMEEIKRTEEWQKMFEEGE